VNNEGLPLHLIRGFSLVCAVVSDWIQIQLWMKSEEVYFDSAWKFLKPPRHLRYHPFVEGNFFVLLWANADLPLW